MGFSWDFNWTFMGLWWDFHGIVMGLWCDRMGIYMDFFGLTDSSWVLDEIYHISARPNSWGFMGDIILTSKKHTNNVFKIQFTLMITLLCMRLHEKSCWLCSWITDTTDIYIYTHLIYVNICIYTYIHLMVSAGIIERKLRSTKVRLFTVPCCSIILFSSEGVKKNRIWIYS